MKLNTLTDSELLKSFREASNLVEQVATAMSEQSLNPPAPAPALTEESSSRDWYQACVWITACATRATKIANDEIVSGNAAYGASCISVRDTALRAERELQEIQRRLSKI